MNKLILLAVVALFPLFSAHAEISKEKRAEIEKMLRATGMENLAAQIKTNMVESMKLNMPDVPEEFWTTFMTKFDTKELIEKIIPLYDKYYTLEDLKAVNAFYESPAGKKVLAVLPQLMKESMQIGQEWGMKIGREAEIEARKAIKEKK